MSDRSKRPPDERRSMARHPAKASTTVIRETDMMRAGIDAVLKDVSPTGIGIFLPTALEVGELVKIRLVNQVQRFEKETRGTVRHVTRRDDGTCHIGIELSLRLTPLDVSLLKMGIPRETSADDRRWY